MKRRDFFKRVGASGAALWAAPNAPGAAEPATERPNILWITCEDMSANLGCFGDTYAITPHLDTLAAQGIRYTQVFSHAPVCAPARSGIITGVYPTTLGSHHMRSTVERPPYVRCFTEYLRDVGYYCSNCSKEDYNFKTPQEAWDDSSNKAHWRHRRAGQPFFSVFNLTVTHESQIRAPDEDFLKRTAVVRDDQRHAPEKAPVPPFHPDTQEVRRDWARYYDLITTMDAQAADILRELEADGLADSTIVFFFSDHGVGLPRGKRWLYDAGLRVPLIIRFPEKYRHFAPAAAGSALNRLVSFMDFAPTVLSLAEIAVPEHMQGVAFLGAQMGEPREYITAGRDRMDERYDCSRAIRTGKYKYIRNFMPHLSRGQFHEYMYHMPTMQAWAGLAKEGKLEGAPALFTMPAKAPEEFYDIRADPYEVNNLASVAEHAATIEKMRATLHDWMRKTKDLGLMPEAEMYRRANGQPPMTMASDTLSYPLARLIETADLQRNTPGAIDELLRRIADADGAVRYWAIIGIIVLDNRENRVLEALRQRLTDGSPNVRIAAADALCRFGVAEEAIPVLTASLKDADEWACLHAANVLDLLGEAARPALEIFGELLSSKNQYVVRVARHAVDTLGG